MTMLGTAPAPYLKPLPAVSPAHQPFFDALRNHQFVVPKCDNCGDYNWVPYPACRSCMSERQTWTPVSGDATLYTFTVCHRGPGAFNAEVPYVIALGELAEPVHLRPVRRLGAGRHGHYAVDVIGRQARVGQGALDRLHLQRGAGPVVQAAALLSGVGADDGRLPLRKCHALTPQLPRPYSSKLRDTPIYSTVARRPARRQCARNRCQQPCGAAGPGGRLQSPDPNRLG